MSNIKILTFSFESTEQALIQLCLRNFNECEAEDHQILRVEAEICDNIRMKSIDRVFDEIKKPILISFKSKVDQRIKTFWKNHESDIFKTLSFVDDSGKEISNFMHSFLVDEIVKNESGVLKSSANKNELNIHDIGSQDGRNLLLIACENNDLNLVEKLLELNFDIDYEDDDNFMAIEIAWDNFVKNDSNKVQRDISEKIMITLLSANSMFPREILDRKCKIDTKFKHSKSELIYEFLYKNVELHVIVQQMHENLDNSNKLIEKINEIRKNHQHMRHFYRSNNKSLMLAAFESENVAVRDKLIELGVSIGQHEINSFAEACSEKKENGNYWELDRFHKKSRLHSFNYPKYHLQILLARSHINYNDQNPSDHWKIIKEAYETIDQDEKCSLILQVAATRNKLHILFDFVNYTACYANPVACIESNGTTDDSGRITIGAKNLLLGGDTRNEVLGVIIHEFCHATMLVVYMNNSNPFQMGNSPLKEYFEKYVTKECETNQNEEKELIGVVFTAYSEEDRSVELITRPPHIWMHYLNNSDKIQLCEKNFSRLCKYFNNLVIPEIENYLKLHPKLCNEDYKIEFDELTDPMKAKIVNTELEFNGIKNSIHGIIDDKIKEYKILESLESRQIKDWIIHNKPIQFEQKYKQDKKIAMIDRELITYYFTQDVTVAKKSEQILPSFILADDPGSGKTETLKLMAIKFKNEHKNKWISFISLKKHESKIRTVTESNSKCVLKNILDLELNIEAEIFYHLFDSGRVILLLDGYDEVCTSTNEFPVKVFNSLQAKKNTVSISTRPHYGNSLKTILKVDIFVLKSLNLKQKEEIIKSVHSSVEADNKKPLEDVLKELKIFLEIIKQNKSGWDYREFNNPLLINILAELFTTNRINIKDVNLNPYKIFEEMTLMLEERVKGKVDSRESSSLIHNKFTHCDVLHVLALKSTFRHDNIKDLKIMKKWEHYKKDWPVDRIQRFGLVILDKEFENDLKSEHINFVHKRYEEFFVAQYFISLITDPLGFDEVDLQELVKLLSYSSNLDCQYHKFIIPKIESEKNKKKNIVENETAKNQLISEANKLKEKILQKYGNCMTALTFILFFICDENDFLKEFWDLDTTNVGQDLLTVMLKSQLCNLSEIIQMLNASFGENWDEKFKYGEKKISFARFLDETTFETEEEKKEQLGILKFFEISENNFSLKDRETFYHNHYRKILRINRIIFTKFILEIIKEDFAEGTYLNLLYKHFINEVVYHDINTESSLITDSLLIKNEIEKTLNSCSRENSLILFQIYNNLVLKIVEYHLHYSTVKYIPEIFNIQLQLEDQKLSFENYFESNKLEVKSFDEISDDGLKQLQKFIKEVDELYEFDISDCIVLDLRTISVEQKINYIKKFISEFDTDLKVKIVEKFLLSIFNSNHKYTKQNFEFIIEIVKLLKSLIELSLDSQKFNNLHNKIQDILITEHIRNNFVSCITDEKYEIVKIFIDFFFENNPIKFRKFLTSNYYVGILLIEDEEKLKNFKNIVNHYSINLTECNEKEQFLKIIELSCMMNLMNFEHKYTKHFEILCKHDKVEIYSKFREKFSFNDIIGALLSDKGKEKFQVLVRFSKNVFSSSELLLQMKGSCGKILDSDSNVDLVGDFLDQVCENHEVLKQAKQKIIFSAFYYISLVFSSNFKKRHIYLKNFHYSLSKFKLPCFEFDETKMKNQLKEFFEIVTKENYDLFKDILIKLFQNQTVDYSYFVQDLESYSLDKVELIERFINDFFKDDKISIQKHMSEVLMHKNRCYSSLDFITKKNQEENENYVPLIKFFFHLNFSQLERITRLYKTYGETWDWVQRRFLDEFPFSSIPQIDEENFNKLLDFLNIIFNDKIEDLKKHIQLKYNKEILKNFKNVNCKKIIEVFNFDVNYDDEDIEDKSLKNSTIEDSDQEL